MEKKGTLGREKCLSFFDAGTFVEVGAYIGGESRTAALVCGYGAVNGKLAYAFAQDTDANGGAFDAYSAKKLSNLYRMAMKNHAPVIGMFDSKGAVVTDGAIVTDGYGTFLKNVAKASGVIPQIAVICGTCCGLASVAASMFDFAIVVEKKGQFSMAVPFLIGKDTNAELCEVNGLSALTAKNEEDAMAQAKKLTALLPSDNDQSYTESNANDDVNRAVEINGLSTKDTVNTVLDAGSVLYLGEKYAPDMVTAMGTLGGVTVGVIANKDGAALTAKGAKKASRLLSLCDSFNLPVVTLVNSEGVVYDKEVEKEGLSAQLAKMTMAYATASVPMVTAIVGKAYGAVLSMMGAKPLGVDIVFALDTASISLLKPEAGVAFLWDKQITQEVTRESLVEKWNKEKADPVVTARTGAIDDVIAPAELRQRLIASVYMLAEKQSDEPLCRHANLPL